MSLKVIWSAFAEIQLDKIYTYYSEEASLKIAQKLVIEIINETSKLEHLPLRGQVEELLKHRKIEYRYIIYKNYKLIYSVDLKNNFVKIADIFDTRQNPSKTKRSK